MSGYAPSSADDGTHLVVIVDLLLKASFDAAQVTQSLDSVIAFATAFLMRSGFNRLTALGSNWAQTTILFHEDLHGANEHPVADQHIEKFANITATFRENFVKWTTESLEIAKKAAAGSSQRNQRPAANQPASLLPGSIAQALCMINAVKADLKHSRILVFSLGGDKTYDYSSQYMKLINCFFAAQKMNVIIDACSVEFAIGSEANVPETSKQQSKPSASMEELFAASILQQGCDLTNGRFIQVHKVSTLMQHLLWIFMPNGEERPAYVLPPKLKIAPPAACFCHRKVLEIGFVCSVCVSIFCQYMPFCSTCNSNLSKNSLNQITHLKQLNLDDKAL